LNQHRFYAAAAVQLWAAVLLCLAACISPPAPTETVPVVTETPTPRSTPSTRTAPTLPPEWTKTFTPTPTRTLTATPTETATPLLTEAEVCAGLLFDLSEADGMEIRSDEGLTFLAGISHEDAALRFIVRSHDESILPEEGSLPGGERYAVTFGYGVAPGTYELTVTVSTSFYTDICEQTATFTVIAPPSTVTPTESGIAVTPAP
jgi:hypothetical protein